MSWWTNFIGLDAIISEQLIQTAWLQGAIEARDHEIQRLTNLILTEHGVIHPNTPGPISSGPPMAINKRASWSQKQKEFEKADAQLARDQASMVHDYWTKKDQEARKESAS